MSFQPKQSNRLITAAFAVAAFAFLTWVLYLCLGRSDIYFLESHAPAEWILYPNPSQCLLIKDSELSATFRRGFVLNNSPASAKLSIRGLTRWSLAINGLAVAASTPGKNWKQATELDVSHQLHPGTNEILVTVFNTNGPPVLWLALDAGSNQVLSGPDWDVSLMDALTVKAAVAGAPRQFINGNPTSGAESPLPSLLKCLPALLVFALFSAAVVVRAGAWLKGYREQGEPEGKLTSAKFAAIAVAIPALLWAVLFLNNHRFLPYRTGYDAVKHLDYIHYIRTFWKLPLATEGWQMYQPPLYYLLSAVLLLPFGPANFNATAFAVLRLFGFSIGVAHFIIIFLCLRVLFPGRLGLQWFGLLLAACLPETLWLSQFVTNESLAATLFSAAIYFCLRILKEDDNSPWLFFGFGLCLGASLLTKFTGIIGLPVFAVALLSRPALNARFPSRIRVSNILLAFALIFAVCGWHYLRVWRHFGNPLLGNWDAAAGHTWWMEDGYHTRSWFFRFGTCLVYPWFSGINGFADGLYSTFWGDGMWSGVVTTVDRPPWNYDLMAAGYLLALLPMFLIVSGTVIAFRRFIRRPDPILFLLVGVAFSTLAALIFMSLKLPSYAQIKSFYGLIALVPICVFGVLGWEFILRRRKPVFLAAATLMGVWAINSYASFWIRSWDPEAHLTLGRFLAIPVGDTYGAIQEYTEALRLAPNDPKVRNRLATQLAHQDPAEMNRLLQLNLKEHPDYAETHSIVSFLFGQQRRFDEGIAEARKAIALAPDQPLASDPLWKLLMAAGRFREAAEASRAGLRVSPTNPEIQCQAGLAFLLSGDPTNAVIHFNHAVTLDPDSADARDGYGTALLALHQKKSALEQSSKAVQLKPDSAAFHYHLAQALAANGKTADAIKECRRALELNPDLSAASDTLKSLEPNGGKPQSHN